LGSNAKAVKPLAQAQWQENLVNYRTKIQNQEPTTNNQQPTTNNQQPTTKNQEPRTKNQEPRTLRPSILKPPGHIMPDLIAIEWDPQCLRGLDVQTTGSSIQVRHVFELPQPSGLAQPELKEWFSHFLAEKHISTKQVVVTLPRESVVVRRLELPDVPEDELPVMVRFQAAAKSSLSLDELSLDFIPLPKREGAVTRDVLLAMVPLAMVTAIQEFVTAAQRELVAIRLSPVGAAELVARLEREKSDDPKSATLIVGRHAERVEISVTWQGQLIFSHAARLAEDNPEQQTAVILTEISRGLISFQNLNLGLKLTEGILLGTDADFPGLSVALQKRLQIAIRTINPFSIVKSAPESLKLIEQKSAFAGLVGSVCTQTQPTVQAFDFLAPRKPVIKPDTTRDRNRQLAIAGAGVAVVLVLAYWMGLSSLDATLAATADQINLLDESLKKGAPTMESAKLLDTWVKEDSNVLDEFKRFQRLLPATSRVYLAKLDIKTLTMRQAGVIRVEGHAREEKDIREFQKKLLAPATGYQRAPNEIKSENKEFYPKKLDELITLGKPQVEKPKAL
jgi:Tfp pilus assembly PilM family ATPase